MAEAALPSGTFSKQTNYDEFTGVANHIHNYLYIFVSHLKLQVQLKHMDIHHFVTWPSAITVSPLFLYLFPPLAGCFSSVLPVFLLCVWFRFISTHVEHLGACYLVSVCRGFFCLLMVWYMDELMDAH